MGARRELPYLSTVRPHASASTVSRSRTADTNLVATRALPSSNQRVVRYKLAYKSPLRYRSLQNLYGAQTIYHSKSLCYQFPPRECHLSRTSHTGVTYKLVYTVSRAGYPIIPGLRRCVY
jgi:hypothetical protein